MTPTNIHLAESVLHRTLNSLVSQRISTHAPEQLVSLPFDNPLRQAGLWALTSPTVPGNDPVAWTVVCWTQLVKRIYNHQRRRYGCQEPLLGVSDSVTDSDISVVQDAFQSLYCPPGSVFRRHGHAPYNRLLQHIPRQDFMIPDNILIMRAGGFKTSKGRQWLAETTPRLNKYLETITPLQVNALLPDFYALLHCALTHALRDDDNNEPYDVFTDLGLAWVDGYLYFHYGRALANLRKVLELQYPKVWKHKDYINNITNIHENLMSAHKRVRQSNLPTFGIRPTPFDAALYAAVRPCYGGLPSWDAEFSRIEYHLVPLKVATKVAPHLEGFYHNYLYDETYAAYIDFKHQDTSLFNMYDVVLRHGGFTVKTPKEKSGLLDSEKVALAKPRIKTDDARVKISYPVLLNARNFGYDVTAETKLPYRSFEPLSMYIHKSANGQHCLTIPDELQGLYEPFILSETTNHVMRSGALQLPYIITKKHNKADRTYLTNRRFYTLKLDNEEPRVHFYEDLLVSGGEVLSAGDHLLEDFGRRHPRIDVTRMNLLNQAYKVFLMWIFAPYQIAPKDLLTGEFAHIVDRQDTEHVDAPFTLKTVEERWNYLISRGRSMNTQPRWLRKATLNDRVDSRSISIAGTRSPKFSLYDEYAFHRALKELEIICRTWYLEDKHRAEYIARRWLPGHTIAYIRTKLPERVIQNLPQRKKKLHRNDPVAFKNFLEHYSNLFGDVPNTAARV